MESNLTNHELNEWFCSLTVKQKEHIAIKIARAAGLDEAKVLYPNCIMAWITLSCEGKNRIHGHCTDKHGMWIVKNEDCITYNY